MISKILCRLSSFFFALTLIITFSVSLKSQGNCVQYDIVGGTAPKGDCIWVPIRVFNFDSILACQFGIAYDPSLIMPVDVWINQNLNGFTILGNVNIKPPGLIRMSWTDPLAGFSGLGFGDTLLMIKFKLIGEPGSCSPIYLFDKQPIFTEILNAAGEEYCVEEINSNDNSICIGNPVNLCVVAHSCGTLTNTGSITITPFGGTHDYTIKWENPAGPTDIIKMSGDSKTYNNLFPGIYQIRVTDSTGKDTLMNIEVPTTSSLVIMPTGIQQPKCLGDSSGFININITGGYGPLLISWRPLNIYNQTTINRLKVGKYTVIVTDSVGCKATEDFLLFADTIFHDVQILKDATCADDGKVIVRASGGNPFPPNNAYCFFWSQHNSFNVCDSVSHNDSIAGKQFVVIQDSRGCMDTAFFEVPFSGDLLDSLVIDSIKCFGDSGMIHSFIHSKGTLNGPMAFRLSDVNNKTIGGGINGVADYISPKLKAGKYYLDVIDNGGCTLRDSFVLTQPQLLEIIDIQTDTTESCNPGKDAFVHVRGFGGVQPYTFTWCDGKTGPNHDSLSKGICAVTITDFNGCTATKTYTITQPNGPRIDSIMILAKPNCPGDKTGSLMVVITPGSGVLKPIKWSVPGQTTTKLNNIGVGRYSVTVTDVNGCEDIDSIDLPTSGNTLRLKAFTLKDPNCNKSSDGFITLTVENQQTPVTYTWVPAVSQSSINTNLKAGVYCVTIDDAGNCPPVDTCFTLVDPPPIDIQLSNLTAPSCATAGTCDGTAIALGKGNDLLSYQIIWSSGEMTASKTDTANQLCAGDQYVIVQNGNFCRDTLFFNVPEPVAISLDTQIIVPPSCYLSKDGSISLVAKGGTGPFQYHWLNPVLNSPTINNLGDGLYFVNIIDSKNCLHMDSIRLRQPDSVRVDIILGSTLDVTCPGKSDGRITTAWTGGNRGKGSFQWTPNINPADSIATNLKEGKYILKVTDEKGCMGTNEYTILAPPPISFTLTPVDTPKCENDQILFTVLQANGGSGPAYKFTINTGAPNDINQLVPLFSGNYAIRIYDKNNCFVDTSITIANPTNFLSLDFGKDIDSIYLGDSIFLDGKLNTTAIIDSIIWSPSSNVHNPGSASSFVSPVKNTTYVLSVIDENGCEVSDQITIIVRNSRKFYAPNIFSPNGDNINDFFSLHIGQGVKAIKSVQIFDRWGNKVYYLENPVIDSDVINTWNGRFGNTGDLMNPAVFVYIAEVVFQDGNTIVYRGDLTLMR